MIYLHLFLEFFAIGIFAVGGGLAVLPFLYALGERTAWFTAADVTFMIGLAESTPGPIAINMATYAGFHTAGLLGGFAATLGLVVPPILIVGLIHRLLERFSENRYFKAAFAAVRPAVLALITVALLAVVQVSLLNWHDFYPLLDWPVLVNWRAMALFGLALVAIFRLKKHPIIYILAGAIAGVLIAP